MYATRGLRVHTSKPLISNLGTPRCTWSSGHGFIYRPHSNHNRILTASLHSDSTSEQTRETQQPEESTVHRGIAFENRSLRLLQQHLSMDLRRVGGRSDGGVDLQGWWWVPSSSDLSEPPTIYGPDKRRRIRVLAQCKMEKKKIGPKYIREMEGVLARHFHNPSVNLHEDPIVGLFLSSSPFTKSALLRAFSSPIPLMLLHLPPITPRLPPDSSREVTHGEQDVNEQEDTETSQPELGSVVCNPTLLSPGGILHGEIEPRWERAPDGLGEGRPGLWYRGRRVISWTPEDGSQE